MNPGQIGVLVWGDRGELCSPGTLCDFSAMWSGGRFAPDGEAEAEQLGVSRGSSIIALGFWGVFLGISILGGSMIAGRHG